MSVCCKRCVLSGRGLCDGLITRPEEFYRVWCVSECDREVSIMGRSWPTKGCRAMRDEGGGDSHIQKSPYNKTGEGVAICFSVYDQ